MVSIALWMILTIIIFKNRINISIHMRHLVSQKRKIPSNFCLVQLVHYRWSSPIELSTGICNSSITEALSSAKKQPRGKKGSVIFQISWSPHKIETLISLWSNKKDFLKKEKRCFCV